MSTEARAYTLFRDVVGKYVDVKQFDDEEIATGVAMIASALEQAPAPAVHNDVPHILTAMGELARELKDPEKDDKVNMTLKSGNKLCYSYANLQSAWPSIRKAMLEHNVVGSWSIEERNGVLFQVFTATSLIDGSTRRASHPFNYTGNDPQTSGSWDTYTRRYTLFACFGLAAGAKDDDGVEAKEASPHTPAKRRPIRQGPTPVEALCSAAELKVSELNEFLSYVKDTPVDVREMDEATINRTTRWIKGNDAQDRIRKWAMQDEQLTPGDFL